MYRINILSTGDYDNFVLGYRYILTKKTTLDFICFLESEHADYKVEKFVRLTKDVFSWSEADADEKLFG